MINQNDISKETMWEATITCDSAYDGLFFYAVKTTGIFCRPSCKSKVPNSENVSFFGDAANAQKAGYRPCKRCRPDLKSKTYDPFGSIIEDTMQIIEKNYEQKMSFDEIATKVGVSRFHLNRLFKDRTGYTPLMYLEKIRINKAKDLLLSTTLNSTEIGYQIGYQSISSFYNAFKRHTGLTPSQFQANYVEKASY
ncbi:bifunctional transcriptional activator/DNA repair enzyme AdaA [Tenuibacillus multivorans]|uniref:AraC family transcriptional regulator, regulatory protein of adaptative response / methylphosphotriester-DNA alkyltransferase methyltransferase n=1 Tax=Tenuibacillus multivorans TaxID=237069 RepID=A0A1H0BQ62_9BACI|nr:bifunctional transcriptional activator/DNA repair enzyme AdaA [Tenuibacillus multivorans]GEL77080.1 AraC family transcriptional regulator [Tenuibacillus multivorans]SDN47663.1 AraC family transcriptional regulator, regulatory protein of adaptative response / methylphosphotriester-DNA alkyltransferase methyltransferase [Tenuibacillus multivorans]